MIVGNDFVIYFTEESNGDDICIKDSLDRFTLVHKDDADELIEALVRLTQPETHSVDMSVTEMFGDD